MYYKDAKGAILVYDIGNADTFNSISYWIDALEDNIKKDNAVLYLVGNKKDLEGNERKVQTAAAQKLADEKGMYFAEVSAKTGDGVADLFKEMAEELAKRNKY
jgi:small GTP-binding protein